MFRVPKNPMLRGPCCWIAISSCALTEGSQTHCLAPLMGAGHWRRWSRAGHVALSTVQKELYHFVACNDTDGGGNGSRRGCGLAV